MRFKNILYAEDDPTDAIIFSMAFKRALLPAVLHIVDDGLAAVDWLGGKGQYSDREQFPEPDILILDLKMPKKNGFEVLQWVRSQADLRRLLVVVLTSSNLQADVDRAYESGANSYLVKPIEFNEMANMIQRFEAYWTELNRFPTTTPSIKSPLAEKTLL